MEKSVHTAGCTSRLVIHMTGDGLRSHGVFLNITVVLERLWDPRRDHGRSVRYLSGIEVVVHYHWHSTGVARNHPNGIHEVLVRQAAIQTLCKESAA